VDAAGASDSGTINAGTCGGNGTCIQPLSTIETGTPAVGQIEVTGEQITQDLGFAVPSGNLPVCHGQMGKIFFDGVGMDGCEANGGILHLSPGPSRINNSNTAVAFTSQKRKAL
jgi:hypothetical protein